MNIKLIGIDLDDTLLNDQKQISKKNIEAINKATEMGVKVVFVSGRPLNDTIIEYYSTVGLMKPNQLFCGFNGAAIFDVFSCEKIYSSMLSLNEIKEIFSFCSENDLACYAYIDNHIIYNKLNEYVLKEYEYNKCSFTKMDFNQIDEAFKAYKINIGEDEKILDEIEPICHKLFDHKYTIVRSQSFYLEFIPIDVDKYHCLEIVSEIYHINKDQIMAIGDSMNDYSFVRASYSVAMGNSVEKLKQDFKYITDTNNNDGVGKIIDKLIINKG